MSISLLYGTSSMAKNLTQPFEGTGGTAPYTYSVIPSGAGGTINAGTGLYTSPNNTGVDVIRVVDSLGAIATATIYVRTALELFCDVIQQGMGLANGRVYLWDQKIMEPTDYGLFIPIQILSCKPFGNTRQYLPITGGFQEVQSTNFQATLSVDIKSRGPEARDRKEEVIMALRSNYAEQQMELNSFFIAKLSSGFVDLSLVDGAAIPYRFNITVNIQYAVTKLNAVSYYDTFPGPTLLIDS